MEEATNEARDATDNAQQNEMRGTNFSDLPCEMLTKIFHLCDKKARWQLRRTCYNFKNVIDVDVGIAAYIQDSSEIYIDSKIRRKSRLRLMQEFLQTVCIREAVILRLKTLDYFLYPYRLKTVYFARGIEKAVIFNVIQACKNLQEIVLEPIENTYGERPDDFGMMSKILVLKKLETLQLKRQEIEPPMEKDMAAGNFLTMVNLIRAPSLKTFTLNSWVTRSNVYEKTTKSLVNFLLYHCATLDSFIVRLKHFVGDSSLFEVEQEVLREFSRNEVEPKFMGDKHLHQKVVALMGTRAIEFFVFLPFLEAQRSLEKVLVEFDKEVPVAWTMYLPLLARNPPLTFIHLETECRTPFDFSCLEYKVHLKELKLIIPTENYDRNTIKGININKLPANLELLILHNFILRESEVDELPAHLQKLKVLGLPHYWHWTQGLEINTGLHFGTFLKFLNKRSMEAIFLQAMWVQGLQRSKMSRINRMITGRVFDTSFQTQCGGRGQVQHWTLKTLQDESIQYTFPTIIEL